MDRDRSDPGASRVLAPNAARGEALSEGADADADRLAKLETYDAWRDDPERLSALDRVSAPGRSYGR
jgi:hypothetical protein